MKKKSIVLMLFCCTFALVLGLAGCGGSGGKSSASADPVAESKAAFTGTWALSSMEQDGETISQNDIELLKSYGMEVTLELKEDGTAALVLFGESQGGTWTPKTATEADATFEGEKIAMNLSDGELSMEQSGSKIVFTKAEASASSSASAASSAASVRGTSYFSEEVDVDPVAIADDNLVKFVVVAQCVDFEGDPGYIFELTNKSDADIYVTCANDSFSVNGQLVDPLLAEEVSAGQTLEGFMTFDKGKVGSSDLSALVAVEGTIEVWDAKTSDTIASYPFQM